MVDGLGEGPVLVVVCHHAGLAGHVQLTALGLSRTQGLQLVLQTINRRCFHNHGEDYDYDRRPVPYDNCTGVPISHLLTVGVNAPLA